MEANRKRKRPVNACATCRARKVKCDERPNGCSNCEKLQLKCVQDPDGVFTAEVVGGSPGAVAGVRRKRTFRSCINCRDSKVKCSGERPVCTRCRQRTIACIYDTQSTEPAWVQSLVPTSLQGLALQETAGPGEAQVAGSGNAVSTIGATTNYPPSLGWLLAPSLPPKPQLHNLLEAYFSNVHPIRVFAFVHKPSFMRRLDEGLLTSPADRSLLYIICALGARFYALDYSYAASALPRGFVQSAGSQWAKIAEEMFFADYSTISITKLQVLILLHDHEARTGNYAGSFLLTGLIIRMAHALQINIEPSTDILCKDADSPNEASLRETRRRLMWACYMVDVWAGSGVDQLTILNDRDIKLQLPCNERQFALQIPCVTECLRRNAVLDFIPAEDVPEKPSENMGMSAYYVRIVNLWQRVLRLVKNLDAVAQPWLPNSDFLNLKIDINDWKRNTPSWLEFSSDNIYIRRESSQLGALLLIHCTYHHVLCDIHRFAFPELFKTREIFSFPPERFLFMASLQTECFDNAQRISVLINTTLQHGVKHLADPILPSFVYNSNRIMLYYIARILDLAKPDAGTVVSRTIELVQQNNQALREMSLMYPLAESLCTSTERWLDKVRIGFSRGRASSYIAPQDPSQIEDEESQEEASGASPAKAIKSDLEPQPAPLSASIPNALGADIASAPPGYPYTSSQHSQLIRAPTSLQPAQLPTPLFPIMEQNMFDLNDLQNFFDCNSADVPIATGFESFGQLTWNNPSVI